MLIKEGNNNNRVKYIVDIYIKYKFIQYTVYSIHPLYLEQPSSYNIL